MREGPLLTAVEEDDAKPEKLFIRQIFITYYKTVDGLIKKETTTREFLRGDYIDSTRIEVLSK